MVVDYDPFSDTAMTDPFPLYRAMRATGCPHFIEARNTWALTRFQDIRKASLNEAALDYSHGQTPGQLLLGEPCPTTFMTMNGTDHRKWRAVVAPFYTADAAEADAPRLRAVARAVLEPLRAHGTLDVYRDYANRVMCRNAGFNLGLSDEASEMCRGLIDEMMHREKDQIGASSERNQAAAGQHFGYLAGFVAALRAAPDRAVRVTRVLMDAEVDGVRLSDQELVFYLFSLLVTGSETTPMAVAATIYYLALHPAQKEAVLADRSLIPRAFAETLRFNQPTNMLARRARQDFELGGQQIKAGQNLLFIYAAANRDEERFQDAERFDIHREARPDLSFGVGGHVCLGLHLGPVAGRAMLEELLEAVGDYTLLEQDCRKGYGEFLSGFIRVPISFDVGDRFDFKGRAG